MMLRDVKECYVRLFHGWCRSFTQHVCTRGLLASGPSRGAQTLVVKFYVPRKTTAAFSDSEVFYTPPLQGTPAKANSVSAWTFELSHDLKSLQTGLIILELQKKKKIPLLQEP